MCIKSAYYFTQKVLIGHEIWCFFMLIGLMLLTNISKIATLKDAVPAWKFVPISTKKMYFLHYCRKLAKIRFNIMYILHNFTYSAHTFTYSDEVIVSNQNIPCMIDQPSVHVLCPLQLFKLLHQAVITQDGSAKK